MDILSRLMADPNISPDLKRVLGAPTEDQALALRRAEYVGAILRFDHQFEFSDDQRVCRAGRDELARLRTERAVVDAAPPAWWPAWASEALKPDDAASVQASAVAEHAAPSSNGPRG